MGQGSNSGNRIASTIHVILFMVYFVEHFSMVNRTFLISVKVKDSNNKYAAYVEYDNFFKKIVNLFKKSIC